MDFGLPTLKRHMKNLRQDYHLALPLRPPPKQPAPAALAAAPAHTVAAARSLPTPSPLRCCGPAHATAKKLPLSAGTRQLMLCLSLLSFLHRDRNRTSTELSRRRCKKNVPHTQQPPVFDNE
uniref:Uncharacterized protein n=1 Tax=Heterosigma akashiwo TaxID=2829 RepID=A0A7S3Y242_HETAK